MLRLGGAVILMQADKIMYYLGNEELHPRPLKIFDERVMNFLEDLSRTLRKNPQAQKYADIITFAFWIRKRNIQKKKEKYQSELIRVGRGIVFHIAPSNIPVNFAFSLVFGLLSGNTNVVRISTKESEQYTIIMNCMRNVLGSKADYQVVRENIVVVSYLHDSKITDYFSSICDIRVVWGGNETINEVRKSKLKPKATEVTFADRYSFSILSVKNILAMDEKQLRKLAKDFYNDTYLIDQNACSSPHLIVWKKDKEISKEDCELAKRVFWNRISDEAKKWKLSEMAVMEKYTSACRYAVQKKEVQKLHSYSNRVYVLDLDFVSEETADIRGRFGLFCQVEISSYPEILPLFGQDTQTITYQGIDSRELGEFLVEYGVCGVDRIVPVGKSLDLDLIWDGYDIICSMSRVIWHE